MFFALIVILILFTGCTQPTSNQDNNLNNSEQTNMAIENNDNYIDYNYDEIPVGPLEQKEFRERVDVNE